MRGGDPVLERSLGGALELHVEGEPQREPVLEEVAVAGAAAGAAERIDAELGQARPPSQETVVG